MKGRIAANYALDSFAVLSYLENEAGAGKVEKILRNAEKYNTHLWMSVINLGEVFYITERERGIAKARTTLSVLDQLPIAVVNADRQQTLIAAHFKARFPISYADAIALATAHTKQAKLLTGDPEFKAIESPVDIEWMSR